MSQHPQRTTSGLSAADLRCNFVARPLSLGACPVRFTWSVLIVDQDCGHDAIQQAYQVRVSQSPRFEERELVWDSGRIESPATHTTIPPSALDGVAGRLWWSVRIWDTANAASSWSPASTAEVGPRGREDFEGAWIGPSENLLACALPEMGAWIAPSQDLGSDGLKSLSTQFELKEGFPRCVGTCWLAADPACTVVLNGEMLEDQGDKPAMDRPAPINLPWDKLKRGENTLAIAGPAGKLAMGVSCMARIWQAEGGDVVVQSGDGWLTGDMPARPKDQPAPSAPIDNGPRRSVELSRRFNLDRTNADARLYVTGLGVFELFINGKRVGDDLFAPGWTDTDCRLYYAAYDVSDLLKPGQNHLLAKLGNGWWSSGMGWEHKGIAAKPGQPLRLLMDLVELSESGDMNRLAVSDDAWQWRPSEIAYDTIYHGQVTDLRENRAEWRPVQRLDDGLEPLIEPAIGEPIRVTGELVAVSVSRLDSGAYLYDFGQNHSGRPRVRATLPEGTRLQIRHCEQLDEHRRPYFENYRTARAADTLIAGAGAIDWVPGFTYRGYRYAVLDGIPEGFEPNERTLVSQLLHNDVPEISSFSCSNDLLNQIDRLVRWGLKTNLHSVPTDCPQRDERLGWTGDVQLIAPTSCWMFDLHGFYTKWLQDLVDAQRPDGGVTHIAPFTPVLPNESAPVWGDVITVLPWAMHQFYDDANLLAGMYEPMTRWVGWYESQAKDGLAEVGGFGDWVALEDTPAEMCGTAYFAHSSRILSQVASILGNKADATRFAEQASAAADAFHRRYYDPAAGHYQPDTQTAQLLALAFDLAPQECRQPAADHLARLVEQRGDKPATGFVGTALLLPALTRFGYHELAYRVLNTRAFPSLGYMIDQGATTVWERWNTDKEGPAMNSRNHFCLGAMAQWFYEELVGIRPSPDAPGFRKVMLEPKPSGDLTSASLRYASPQGRIDVQWRIESGQLVYEVTLPANVQARLRLPSSDPDATRGDGPDAAHTESGRRSSTLTHANFDLGAGRHRLVTPATRPSLIGVV